MLSYRLVLYYDICIVSLKYFFAYGTLNLIFFTLHYITTGQSRARLCVKRFRDCLKPYDWD